MVIVCVNENKFHSRSIIFLETYFTYQSARKFPSTYKQYALLMCVRVAARTSKNNRTGLFGVASLRLETILRLRNRGPRCDPASDLATDPHRSQHRHTTERPSDVMIATHSPFSHTRSAKRPTTVSYRAQLSNHCSIFDRTVV